MKTTIDLPRPLLHAARAAAAGRGESLDDLLASALRRHLAEIAGVTRKPAGWHRVFGKARAADVARVDAIIAADLKQIGWADRR